MFGMAFVFTICMEIFAISDKTITILDSSLNFRKKVTKINYDSIFLIFEIKS